MVYLYVTSTEPGAGKTALCAGLGLRARAMGKRVTYLKPLSQQKGLDKDTLFLHDLLGLAGNPPSSLSLNGQSWEKLSSQLQALLASLAGQADLGLLEGLPDQSPDSLAASLRVLEAAKARALLVARYQADGSEALVQAAKALGTHLLGVVINSVPGNLLEKAKSSWTPSLEKAGVRVLGFLPQDRALLSVSVQEMADFLGGEFRDSQPGRDELVQSLMIGANTPDPGLDYYKLKENKAVITRCDRGDQQMAALETSTRCLVLTGGGKPFSVILTRAREKGVPIMVVTGGTIDTATQMEGLLGQARFHQRGKVSRLKALLDQHLNWDGLFQPLGLPPTGIGG
ncbi:MAG: DRTGG domain-containing protein [Chloroflexota bacterium]|nr:DRTGG domain-containing protein [Chloroflexota bacterium]